MLNIIVSIFNIAASFLLLFTLAIVLYLFVRAIPLMTLRIQEEYRELKKKME